MLVQRFAGAFFALLVSCPLGAGAAEAGSVGLGLSSRLISFGAFSIAVQVDGFPHDDHHQPKSWYGAANPTARELSRVVSIDSVRIRKIPHKIRRVYLPAQKRQIFVPPLPRHTNRRMHVGSTDLYQRPADLALNKN